MKAKLIIILVISLFFMTQLFCVEAVLIDFNNLENTTIDFSKLSQGKGFPEEVLKEMNISLDPSTWLIRINSSSWIPESRDKTYLFPIKNSQHYANQTVLGVRVFFPERHANSFVVIKPPFEIPSYYDSPQNPNGNGEMFLNKGVVRNVGVLRKLSVLALGNNFRYSLYVKIKDHRNEERDVFVGFLDFQGWKIKSWLNPNLDFELKNRELKKKFSPQYPDEYPYLKLMGFVIQRTDPEITGNFVTMIKEVTIEYDEAIIPTGKTEDRQEEIFGIYREELVSRAKHEMWNVDRRIYLEWEERQKQHKDSSTEPRNQRGGLSTTTTSSSSSAASSAPKTN